jgi:putative transcriptional regulator
MSDRLAPGFLIAVPHLADPNFRHSVVLLLHQTDEGAMGVIVNRESELLLRELCRDHDIRYGGVPGKRVRQGGPVRPEQGLVLYGAEHRDPEGERVVDGLHVSASRGTLTRLCDLQQGRFHCFSGYAGWGPGQLEREICEGAWVIAAADASMILDTPAPDIWSGCLHSIGIDPTAMVPGAPGVA